MTQALTTLAVGALCVAAGCSNTDSLAPASATRSSFQQAPADGNGGKIVIPIDEQFPDFATCPNGATLSLHAVGWVQVHVLNEPNNRNLELDGLQLVLTYSNAAGQTFVWREIGPDHFYIDDNGDLIHTISGRDGFDGVIGHFVINETTGEVTFIAGNQTGTRDDRACGALT